MHWKDKTLKMQKQLSAFSYFDEFMQNYRKARDRFINDKIQKYK